ncbi:MAG: hypothetical protein HY856_13460 [Burkholderiales bacterium]|nr:hypothetical protein [Burkholderiales bacterium]
MSQSSLEQAAAQVASIVELIDAYDNAADSDAQEQALNDIYQDPLEVSVRSGWHLPGVESDDAEFRIVLCTGGPHVELRGDLDEHGSPDSVKVLHNDWFEGLTDAVMSDGDQAKVLRYCQILLGS